MDGRHGRSLAPKEPQWDARSVSSALSDTEGHADVHRYGDTYSTYKYASPYASPQYSAYPPSYPQEQEVPVLGQMRPQTADSELGTHRRAASLRGKSASSRWKRPWFCYIISAAQLATFIGQCVHGWKLTGSPIEIHPSFNPMIGPSVYNSINMGARFVPCMKYLENITDVVTAWPCPNATTTAGLSACSLTELCSNGAKESVQPAQWWRFIVPIFLHAGIIHIAFNLMVQLRLGTQIEMDVGTPIFIPIYFAAGIGGFLFGGNFAGDGVTSCGASGAIFSIISLSLLDLLYHWNQVQAPKKGLFMLIADIVVSFVLGLLPGVDNFSHIGGFIIGMLLGIAFLRSPDSLDRRLTPYQKVNLANLTQRGTPETHQDSQQGADLRDRKFLQDRSSGWWAFVLLRLVCTLLTIIIFILLIKNFYNLSAPKCTWCKYLSCIPVSNWCSIGDITTTTTTSGS